MNASEALDACTRDIENLSKLLNTSGQTDSDAYASFQGALTLAWERARKAALEYGMYDAIELKDEGQPTKPSLTLEQRRAKVAAVYRDGFLAALDCVGASDAITASGVESRARAFALGKVKS